MKTNLVDVVPMCPGSTVLLLSAIQIQTGLAVVNEVIVDLDLNFVTVLNVLIIGKINQISMFEIK